MPNHIVLGLDIVSTTTSFQVKIYLKSMVIVHFEQYTLKQCYCFLFKNTPGKQSKDR